jgi:thiamine-phosphate pyrophosphorylase
MAAKAVEGLYAVTPDLEDSRALQEKVAAALRGGVRLVQYRSKIVNAPLRSEQARALAAMCRQAGARLIINDDPQLAALCRADGVHLGAQDAPVEHARRILGPAAVIGVSCYSSLERATRAAEKGADYVAFGAFFPSSTKPGATAASLSLLREADSAIALPIVAIGGITAANARQVIEAGADAVAVVSALFDAVDIETEARRLLDTIQAALLRRAAARAA